MQKLFTAMLAVAMALSLSVGPAAAWADDEHAAEPAGALAAEEPAEEPEAGTAEEPEAEPFAGPAEEPAAEGSAPEPAAPAPVVEPAAEEPAAPDAGEPSLEALSLEPEAAHATPLPKGTYYFQNRIGGTYVFDVAGGSVASGANVQIYHANLTEAQRWVVDYDTNGLYTIKSAKSGLLLEAAGGAKNNANVRQAKPASGKALHQKWVVVKKDGTYTIASAADESLVLDVAQARTADRTNVQLHASNGTNAQKFFAIPLAPKVKSERTVDDGVYIISAASASGSVLDVEKASFSNGANVRLWKANGTVAQRWSVKWNKAGYYTINSMSSGRALAVLGNEPTAWSNICQQAVTEDAGQRWAIRKNPDGSHSFVNLAGGMALHMQGGKTSRGTNVITSAPGGSAAQRFNLKKTSPLPDGFYTVYSMAAPTSRVVDVPSGAKTQGLQMQLYQPLGGTPQKFLFENVSGDVYTVKSAVSGKFLADNGKGQVVQAARSGKVAQQWRVAHAGNGLELTNVSTGKPMAIANSSAANGCKLVTGKASAAKMQRFRVAGVPLIPDGIYHLRGAKGLMLDVAGGTRAAGANIQLWSSNGAVWQKFRVQAQGAGYVITNVKSNKSLDVPNGSKANGASIRQWPTNGAPAQRWLASVDDAGRTVFTCEYTGKALSAATASAKAGTDVRQLAPDGSAAQGWTLIPTAYTPPRLSIEQIRYPSYDHGPKPRSHQKYIMLHDTAGIASAQNVAHGWVHSRTGAIAAHFVVGQDGTIVQCVDLDRIAHHAGWGGPGNADAKWGVGSNNGRGSGDDLVGVIPNGSLTSYGMNSYSVGIEMVHVTGTPYPEAQLNALDRLIEYIDDYFGFECQIIDHKMWRTTNPDTDAAYFTRYLNNYRAHRTHN